MPKKLRLNDQARRVWVESDEELQQNWRASGLPLGIFVKANRSTIDKVANDHYNQKP